MAVAGSPRLAVVGLGLPVYNGERFLGPTIECFLGQTFGDFELVICDNASTDATEEIARSFCARDRRLRYSRNERNLGAVPNFNRALMLSDAPLFKWIAHDDLHHKDYLETCVSILNRYPDTVLAHSAALFIDERGAPFPIDPATGASIDPRTGAHQRPDSPLVADSPFPVERFRQVLAEARWGSHMFGVIRRAALAQTRLVPDFASGDRVMLAELALLGRFRASHEPLFQKRFHEAASWALDQRELKSFMNTDGRAYSRRRRQLEAFFSAPWNKPIGLPSKIACTALVAQHAVRTAVQAAAGKEDRNAKQGRIWRRESAPAKPRFPAAAARLASSKHFIRRFDLLRDCRSGRNE